MVRYTLLFLTALIYPVAQLLRTLRLTRNRDPWRRIIGLGLRSEGTKFELSLLGLKGAPGRLIQEDFLDSEFAARYMRFLRDQSEIFIALSHHRFWVERITTSELDFVLAEFAENGSLIRFKTDFDSRSPLSLPTPIRLRADEILLQAHRDTMRLPEAVRPRELWHCVSAGIGRVASEYDTRSLREYARRLSRAWFLSIETGNHNSETRFFPPDFRLRRNFGSSSVNTVFRFHPNEAVLDLWWQVHHAAADGAELQEILNRLKSHFGNEEVAFPEKSSQAAFVNACEITGVEPPIALAVGFLDLQTLLRKRKRLNERNRSQIEVPLVAILLWNIVQQPEFRGRRFAIAVDVPPDQGFGRAVDLISVAPESPSGLFTDEELLAFAREFNSLAEAARNRTSPTYRAMEQLAILPSWLAHYLLKYNRTRTRTVYGSLGLSILRDASVFVAPMSDGGFEEGFLAIGNAGLTTVSQKKVACITFKGPRERVSPTWAALARISQDKQINRGLC
jgi:hypothetical protein